MKKGKGLHMFIVLVLLYSLIAGQVPMIFVNAEESTCIPIQTADDFNQIRHDLTGDYCLTEDIDLSTYINWEPISQFKGTLDGQGHTISNLTINRPDTVYVGLFSIIRNFDEEVAVKNLNFENVNILGNYGAGALAGFIETSSIKNVHVLSGQVETEDGAAGGLIGWISNSSVVEDSSSDAIVQGKGKHVGGLIGRNSSGNGTKALIKHSHATGNVTGNSPYVGGLMGSLNYGEVVHSYATGKVTGDDIYVGGLIGRTYGGEVMNSHAEGNVWGANAGGLIGSVMDGTLVDTTFATGDVSVERSMQVVW